MKIKTVILFMLLLIIAGCTNTKDKVDNTETTSEGKETTETFKNENYVHFPKVKNLVNYLDVAPKDVKILAQSDNNFTYCLTVDHTDDESVPSASNYVRSLEKEGYKLAIYDGTISSTYELEKENCVISITMISDVEEWKKTHVDDKDYQGVDIQSIDDENLVCKMTQSK